MSVTVAIRFPLGRYHATPWDRSVNEGVVEWPPSPWRLLRALVATWYTRWPELPAPVLDELLAKLGDPPSYQCPSALPAHTRHYLPDLNHRRGETGSTDLALDPFLWVDRGADLLARWETELSGEQRAVLAKLLELMPYLGRAESVCEARLLDESPDPDETWWRPGAPGERIRLLAVAQPVRRPALELTTVEMRRARRTLPPGATWVTYGRRDVTAPSRDVTRRPVTGSVEALRFAVISRAPLAARNGVLLADAAHKAVVRAFNGGRREVIGHKGARTDHQHAHWVPLGAGDQIDSLLVWVPAKLTHDEVARMLWYAKEITDPGDRGDLIPGEASERRVDVRPLRNLSGRRGDYEVKGLPKVDLLFQAAGAVEQVAPELCGPARRWRSLTPYLPVRHRKRRQTLDEYLAQDVAKELGYRGLPSASVRRLNPERGEVDSWATCYRRYRIDEKLRDARPGYGLVIEFEEEQTGPILLGQLSHFGFGVFQPA